MIKDKEKYNNLMEEIRSGKSINQTAKENNVNRGNLKRQLKKRFPEEYQKLIYGKIIGKHKNYILRKIPNNQTNRNECDITKKAKEFIKKKYDCIEEVGVWKNNGRDRVVIDLYSIRYKTGFEIYWQSGESYKRLKKKLLRYRKYFGRIVCVLLKDSNVRTKNRSYYYIIKKLKYDNIEFVIFDLAHPSTEVVVFPMEL